MEDCELPLHLLTPWSRGCLSDLTTLARKLDKVSARNTFPIHNKDWSESLPKALASLVSSLSNLERWQEKKAISHYQPLSHFKNNEEDKCLGASWMVLKLSSNIWTLIHEMSNPTTRIRNSSVLLVRHKNRVCNGSRVPRHFPFLDRWWADGSEF